MNETIRRISDASTGMLYMQLHATAAAAAASCQVSLRSSSFSKAAAL